MAEYGHFYGCEENAKKNALVAKITILFIFFSILIVSLNIKQKHFFQGFEYDKT